MWRFLSDVTSQQSWDAEGKSQVERADAEEEDPHEMDEGKGKKLWELFHIVVLLAAQM